MTEIIIKADRKAKAAMDEILERSDKYTGNGYNTNGEDTGRTST